MVEFIPAKQVSHEARALRNAIKKHIEHKHPGLAADVLHWLYTDVLLGNFEYESVLQAANGSKETIERCARRYFKREN